MSRIPSASRSTVSQCGQVKTSNQRHSGLTLMMVALGLILSCFLVVGCAQTPAKNVDNAQNTASETDNSTSNGDTEGEAASNSEGAESADTSNEPEMESTSELHETDVTGNDDGAALGEASDEATMSETPDTSASRVLVVYFSNTGHTEAIAQDIHEDIPDSTLFKIEPVQPYTSEDLNYNDSSTRATVEQNDGTVRPEIANQVEDMASYDTIFMGYPIWWGKVPRIMLTFLESYDFSGKTIIPFCTSGSSDIAGSIDEIRSAVPNAVVEDGRRFSGSASRESVDEWVHSLGY